MAPPTVRQEEEFDVLRFRSENSFTGAAEAFARLEAPLDSLRGLKMYGVFYPGDPEEYFACLRVTSADVVVPGAERATVPGGLYGRTMVRNWQHRLPELPTLFDDLRSGLVGAGYALDPRRPSIEFYRRTDELVIMVPVDRSVARQP